MISVRRQWPIAAAVAAAIGLSGTHLVAQTPAEPIDETAAAQQQAAAAPVRPLMGGLDALGIGRPLRDANLNIFGHIQGSYTYNFNDPAGDVNAGRVFDIEHSDPTLNQIDLTIERTVDVSKKSWDIGFRVEGIWGGDSRFIKSNGLFDDDFATYGLTMTQDGPDQQFDLPQAYFDLAVPVGNGLLIRAGRTYSPIGYESINPTASPFYSRSYLFGFAVPFTHTGVLASYRINPQWLVEGSVFRGWEQSADDNNDAVSFHGKVMWTSADQKWNLTGQFCTGPEQADNEDDYRTLFDFIATYAATDRLSLALNADFGFEPDVASDGGDAQWYGIAGYAAYKIDDRFTLNGRVEWFNDDDGSRGLGTDVYEITAGLAIRPFPNDEFGSNLLIRPEIRADFAADDIFDGGTESSQFTAGLDMIFTF